jgi:hypothetical protein
MTHIHPLYRDLYGALGTPPHLSRTVVAGHRALVCRLLYVLSYFIRCSEVCAWRPVYRWMFLGRMR